MKDINLQAYDPYWTDFLAYYAKASLLEQRNHYRLVLPSGVGDPLMDNVTIYDTVHRRYTGFSNVLRDLHWLRAEEFATDQWDLRTWLFIYGIHRMTGSGASFYPPWAGDDRHGYKNTIIFELARCDGIEAMLDRLFELDQSKVPMFTCLGNQAPPFPKLPADSSCRLMGTDYFCRWWPQLVDDLIGWLNSAACAAIEPATDWILEWNVQRGAKRFKFAMTAFVMDIADWWPTLVDPASRCHYGANGLVAMNAIFSTHNRSKSLSFYHACMNVLCEELHGNPMDIEDALCDAVRYWSGFVPKVGYDHLTPEQRQSASLVDVARFKEFLTCTS
jgi:hypothetical protein